MGKVIAVCTSPEKGTVKTNVHEGKFIENFGIEGDAHAGKWHRQVSMLSFEQFEAFRKKGAPIEYGAFGENLLVEGFDFNAEFQEVKDGKLAGAADSAAIMDMDAKVVILSEKVDVKVDGKVRYVSSDFATISGEDTVSLQLPEDAGDAEKDSLVYVVYE